VQALVRALRQHRGLTCLDFKALGFDYGSDVSHADAASMYGAAVANMRGLRTLRLDCTGQTDTGVRPLLPLLAPLTRLEHLQLNGCELSREYLCRLRTSLRFSKWMAEVQSPSGSGLASEQWIDAGCAGGLQPLQAPQREVAKCFVREGEGSQPWKSSLIGAQCVTVGYYIILLFHFRYCSADLEACPVFDVYTWKPLILCKPAPSPRNDPHLLLERDLFQVEPALRLAGDVLDVRRVLAQVDRRDLDQVPARTRRRWSGACARAAILMLRAGRLP
jgi:hypothetical protein